MTQLALLADARPLADRLLSVLEVAGPLTYDELLEQLGCGPELALPLAEACRHRTVIALSLSNPPRYERRRS